MVEYFGNIWGFEYDEIPDVQFFPRGIYNLTENKWER
jgi:hypothetical protein